MAAARSMGEAQPQKPYYGDNSNSPKKKKTGTSFHINEHTASIFFIFFMKGKAKL
jgi:hypothetical protein